MPLADYFGVTMTCGDELKEILIAEMSELGYESMMETDEGFEAYIPQENYSEEQVKELIGRYPGNEITFTSTKIVSRNWNEEWEHNYDPIAVGTQCYVRATFHKPAPEYQYELIISPMMSFGTGHHATTYLMLMNQLNVEHQNKRVLDAGCGTAILAVMAEKLGAREVLAYDNNSWTAENAPENLSLNNCSRISIQEGTIASIDIHGEYDIILANINKNVLLEELPAYVSYLTDSGVLILSGFYAYDEPDLLARASELGLLHEKTGHKNGWSSLRFKKITH